MSFIGLYDDSGSDSYKND